MFRIIGMVFLAVLAIAGSEFLAATNPVYGSLRGPFVVIVTVLFFLSQALRDLAPKGG